MKYYTNRAPKPQYESFDICYAHMLLEMNYNISGVLQERKSNIRRNMSTAYQLNRMWYHPGIDTDTEFNDNVRGIYKWNVRKLGLGIKPRIYKSLRDSKHQNNRLHHMIGFKGSRWHKNDIARSAYCIYYLDSDYDLIR